MHDGEKQRPGGCEVEAECHVSAQQVLVSKRDEHSAEETYS